ncbi:MAG: DMT family transporter [Bdellovibrionales bacterium]|nr:DMT family transporter [Bdellovibrionales bacterium]
MIDDYPEYKKGILFAIGTALCWAVLAILLKFSLSFSDSYSIVWVRMSIASLIIAILIGYKNKKDLLFLFRAPKSVYLAALALAFNYIGFMMCIDLTTASNAQIMIQMGPLLLAISGILFFKEFPKGLQIVGFIIASLGFLTFFNDQLQISWSNKDQYLRGNAWVLGAAIAWAYFSIVQKIQAKTHSSINLLLVLFFSSAVIFFPFADFKNLFALKLWQIGLICLLGINSWIAYAFLSEALKRAPASHVSLVITLNPLLTIFSIQLLNHWNLLFIKYEPLNLMGYIGTALVIAGVSLTVLTQKTKTTTPSPVSK